jgi:toxin FitB
MRAWMDGHALPTFEGRILPIDAGVARRCARLHIPDRGPSGTLSSLPRR